MSKIKPINSTIEWLKTLKLVPVDETQYNKAVSEMNKTMEETRKIFQEKERKSQISAANVVISR